MKSCKRWILGTALALAPLLSGASFAAAPPPAGGTIALESTTVRDGSDDPEMPAFFDAASVAFTARGFTILEDPAHSAYVAELTLSRAAVGTGMARDPRGTAMMGTGVAVPFATGDSRFVTLERTKLEIRIRKRGEPGTVWDGAAVTVRSAGTAKGGEQAVATVLCRALLDQYPTQPQDVLGVP